jgi:hypothetical protein
LDDGIHAVKALCAIHDLLSVLEQPEINLSIQEFGEKNLWFGSICNQKKVCRGF